MPERAESLIVLASTSRHRRALMDRLDVDYRVASPLCDESLPAGTHPREGTLALSCRKARSVRERFPDALIIGSDQMAAVDGEILSKPGTAERAVEQLMRLAGRTHELWTGLCVLDARTGRERAHVQVWRMTLGPIDRRQARAYVEEDGPLDCAGSYRYESLGRTLFERVEGEDPTAITGLPLEALVRILGELGTHVSVRKLDTTRA
jgi:septum formation protein